MYLKITQIFGHNLESYQFITLFILQAKCDLNTGSSSPGQTCKDNVHCQLNQNTFNQYLFLILWYWFIILFIIGMLQLIFEAACIVVPSFRFTLIRWKLPPLTTERSVESYLEEFEGLGQWFLLYQISGNMNKHFFYEFIKKISPGEAVPLNEMANAGI